MVDIEIQSKISGHQSCYQIHPGCVGQITYGEKTVMSDVAFGSVLSETKSRPPAGLISRTENVAPPAKGWILPCVQDDNPFCKPAPGIVPAGGQSVRPKPFM
jgi:hypothetical protein